MVRNVLVPTMMALKLLGPRLLVAKFRGSQKHLSVVVAHAPTSKATEAERNEFYTSLSAATDDCSESDTKIVLIDANAGPGVSRLGGEHIIGPHGIPYAGGPMSQAKYCYGHGMLVGHTWFKHKALHKITYYPWADNTGEPRDMDHVLINGRSCSMLEDVRVRPGTVISTSEKLYKGSAPGHRAVVARIRCRLQSRQGNVPMAPYIRADCLKKDVQGKIQATLQTQSVVKRLGNQALDEAGLMGAEPDCARTPPSHIRDPPQRALHGGG